MPSQTAAVRLHALGAETTWLDDPRAAVAWQRDALATGLFAGSHADLEPWQRPKWSSDREAVLTAYLVTLRALKVDAAASGHRLEADVAFWPWTLARAHAPSTATGAAVCAWAEPAIKAAVKNKEEAMRFNVMGKLRSTGTK